MLDIVNDFATNIGISSKYASYLEIPMFIFFVVMVSSILILISNRLISTYFYKIIQNSKTKWDDIIYEKGLFKYVSYLIPAVILILFSETLRDRELFQRIGLTYLVTVVIFIIHSFLSVVEEIYQTYKISKERPIRGYIQITKIIVIITGSIISIGTIIDKSPWKLLSGIGAFTAILLLVFKDSILGLVAGIQLAGNKLVKIGDWIEMEQYGANGEVIEININKIIIKNWDKTITSVPVYSLVSESFKNWQGMIESNARRIKKSIYINVDSIKFCDDKMISYMRENGVLIEDNSIRNNSNLQFYRKFIYNYIKKHPNIREDLTILVRLLQPNENGVPLEIYCFSNEIDWALYEEVSSSILEYIISSAEKFDIEIFQRLSDKKMEKFA